MSLDPSSVLAIAFVLATLPVCFVWPWIGSLLWWWVSFTNPFQLATGLGFEGWIGSLMSLATVAGAIRSRERFPLPRSREVCLLVAFWIWCVVTTAVAAIDPPRAWKRLAIFSQIVVMTVVVVALFQERRKLTIMLWVTALSLGLYAAHGASWILWTGNAARLDGPLASQIENNNDLAAALVALAPFFVFLGARAANPWLRAAALLLFGAMVIAILGTYSRASFLALCVMLVWLGAIGRWRAVAVAGVALIIFLLCTPAHTFARRIDTIRTYQKNTSAQARLASWYVALRIGLDHPLLGAGFRPFSDETYERYLPGYVGWHDAHNMFLQVFAEHGFPGLVLYAALIASTLRTLWRLVRDPPAPAAGWFQDAAHMLLMGLITYVVAGTFHCLSYREILFHLLGLAIVLHSLARARGHVVAHARPR